MKNNIVKIASIIAVFALGIGVAINTQKQPISVSAAQHADNYSEYTYSGNYYSSITNSLTDGLNGTLRTTLGSLILPKDWYTYSGSSDGTLGKVLQSADEDPTNSSNMVMLYTRDSISKRGAGSGTGQWNREHDWPRSLSHNNWSSRNGGSVHAGTDILHVRPSWYDANETRGSIVYGDNNKSGAQQYNGMTYAYTGGNYFEPLDSVQGDVARILMYVWTAYRDYYNDSGLVVTSAIQSYVTLLKWHTMDKPDALEGHRNDFSETSKQKNRNPFVDHPEYAWRIFGDSCSAQVKSDCMAAYPIEGYVPNPGGGGQSGGQGGGQGQGGQSGQDTIPTSGTCNITFLNNGEDSGDLVTSENYTDYVDDNTLVESVSNLSKVYPGAEGLKLGSGSATGSITFNLLPQAKNNVDAIYINSTQYKSDSGKLVLKVNGQSVDNNIQPGEDYSYTFTAPTSVNSITLETTSKRAYINELAVHIHIEDQGGGQGGEQGGEQGGQGGSSSEPIIIDPTPIDNGTSESPVNPEVEEKGCGGSMIATTSLLNLSSLAGLSFIFIKRRRY